MIGRLAADGKAVLISSHILTELAEICHSVGIIEQGELLAVGSVEEMKRRLVSHMTVIRVRVLDRVTEVAEWLGQQSSVESVSVRSDTIFLEFEGEDVDRARLLRELVAQGFDVVSFAVQDRNLEEVFLDVTKGRVQ